MRPISMHPSPISQTADTFFASLAHEVAVMGILNVTPDSFSGDGTGTAVDVALAQALAMQKDGCAVLDIGGESTRPGSVPVSAEEEAERVMPVMTALRNRLSLPLSIDTSKAVIARKALDCGAHIVNDVQGLQADPAMADVVAEAGAGVVIMHNRPKADPQRDIMADIRDFFQTSLDIAERAGIAKHRIALDPGIGFGKTFDQNLIILNRLTDLREHGKPLLIGLSRKRFIGAILDQPVDRRLNGTLAANLAACMAGASILRVHDVAPHVEAVRMLAAIRSESHG
ncbi:MAG: dihydropteroate synthase [Pseudomonadota bacterium]